MVKQWWFRIFRPLTIIKKNWFLSPSAQRSADRDIAILNPSVWTPVRLSHAVIVWKRYIWETIEDRHILQRYSQTGFRFDWHEFRWPWKAWNVYFRSEIWRQNITDSVHPITHKEAQLSPRDSAMLRVIEYFAKSLTVICGMHCLILLSKRLLWIHF